MATDIDNHLSRLRARRGMAAAELARIAGVTRQTIYAWIRAGRLKSVTDADGRIRILAES